jgi:hypothetical protein
MSGGGKKDWRGGKSRRESSRAEEAAPGWKQVRKPTRPQRTRRRLRTKAVLPSIALVALVAVAIWMYLIPKPHYTYLLVFNPLQKSEFFLAGESPDLAEGATGMFNTRRVARSVVADFDFLQTVDEQKATLGGTNVPGARHTVIVYVQTIVLPGGAPGTYRCLVKNSDFDLDQKHKYTNLSLLKAALQAYRKKNPDSGMILLVDLPAVTSPARLGWTPSDVLADLATWPNGIEHLFVMTACGGHEDSVFAGMGGGGKTAFAHFASCGLSDAADVDDNREISVSEFCRYVRDETRDWVTRHRRLSGQHVAVSPPLDELSEDDAVQNFVVLKDPLPVKTEIPVAVDAELERQLSAQRVRSDKLYRLHAWRWNPMAWRVAVDSLSMAELALLNGQFTRSGDYLKKATKWFGVAELDTQGPTAMGFNPKRNLARFWFDGLPVQPRLVTLWEPDSEAAVTPWTEPLAEDVLLASLDDYPFAQMDVAPPAGDQKTAAVDRRAAAELAVAQLYGAADRVQSTVSSADQRLLESEDLLFTSRHAAAQSSVAPINELFEGISAYGQAWQAADSTLCQVLELAPSLSAWASAATPLYGHENAAEWRALLLQNRVDALPTQQFVEGMLTKLERIEVASKTGWKGKAIQLRAEVFRLFVRVRALQASLDVREPDSGFSNDDLQSIGARLNSTRADCDASLKSVRQLSDELVGAVLAESPEQRDERVAQYQRLRCLLTLNGLSAVSRSHVVKRTGELDAKLADGGPDKDSEQTEDNQQSSDDLATVKVSPGMLWSAQVLNLHVRNDDGKHPAAAFWTLLVQRERAAAAPESAQLDAALGEAVRELWVKRREAVASAIGADADSLKSRLSSAVHVARLLPATDAESLSPDIQNPVHVLTLLRRLDFCLLHVGRLLSGQWVNVTDRKPLSLNGWYARQTEHFLNSAEQLQKKIRSERVDAAAAISQRITGWRDRLKESDQLQIVADPDQAMIDLGEQNHDRGTVNMGMVVSDSTVPSGIAALSLLPVSEVQGASVLRVEGNAAPIKLSHAESSHGITVVRVGNPVGDDCQSIPWRPLIFFRGRNWSSQKLVQVSPCAGAEYITQYVARPRDGSLVVSDTDSRPIAFVLDWSDSMKDPTVQEAGRLKSVEALAALKREIGTLDETRKVSLRVFGHRVRNDAEYSPVRNTKFEKVFGEKIPALPALDDVQLLIPTARLTRQRRSLFDEVLKKLKRSEPWGITPLTLAVTECLQDDLDNGSGVVIVITDGAANDNSGRYFSRVQNLHEAIIDVKDTAKLVIAAFDLQDDPAARQSIDQLFQINGMPAASIVAAADGEELSRVIANSLDPRKFTIRRSDLPDETYPATELNQYVRQLRAGDDYIVEFGGLSSKSIGLLKIRPGDAWQVRIDWRIPEFVFYRESNPQRSSNANVPSGSSPTTPTMLQAHSPAEFEAFRSDNNMSIAHVDLSLMLNHDRNDVPVTQPAEIEFQFLPPPGTTYRPAAIRQEFTSEWGAPGWNIRLEDWPEQYDVTVMARWKMVATPPDLALTWQEIRTAASKQTARHEGGEGAALPEVLITTQLLDGGVLQVRLDPVTVRPEDPANRVEDISVAVGRRDRHGTNTRFTAVEVTRTVTRTDKGSAVFEFHGRFTEQSLAKREIAFTSAASRHSGSIQTTRPLRMPRVRK